MCNRYAIENPDNVEKWLRDCLDAEFLEIIKQSGIKFTASPTNLLPVVISTDARPRVTLKKWGVWFVNQDGKKVGPYMNAKKELALKNWRAPVQNRRCIIPADGFFEWPPDPPKTPWLFRRPGNKPFAFAGVFTEAETFAFLTTLPNNLTASIGHPRSPIVLTENNVAAWLRPGELSAADIESFAVPYAGEMSKARVTMRMNRSGYNEPDAVVPLTAEEIAVEGGKTKIVSAKKPNGDQLSLF